MRDAKKPFVTLKLAETLDGRIAAADGSSKWISNARSRKLAHALRARHDAILVGVGTVIKDNPSLTTRRRWRSKRRVGSRNPVRIILDTYLRTPLDSKVIKTAKRTPAFIVVSTRVSDPASHT